MKKLLFFTSESNRHLRDLPKLVCAGRDLKMAGSGQLTRPISSLPYENTFAKEANNLKIHNGRSSEQTERRRTIVIGIFPHKQAQLHILHRRAAHRRIQGALHSTVCVCVHNHAALPCLCGRCGASCRCGICPSIPTATTVFSVNAQ